MHKPRPMAKPNPPPLYDERECINGFEMTYNPDDDRWYVCDRNTFGDLETRATYANNGKGVANARRYMRTHQPR